MYFRPQATKENGSNTVSYVYLQEMLRQIHKNFVIYWFLGGIFKYFFHKFAALKLMRRKH